MNRDDETMHNLPLSGREIYSLGLLSIESNFMELRCMHAGLQADNRCDLSEFMISKTCTACSMTGKATDQKKIKVADAA